MDINSTSYGHAGTAARDLTAAWSELALQDNSIMSLITKVGKTKNPKVEWTNSVLFRTNYKVTVSADGAGTSFTLDNVDDLKVGSVVKFQKANGGAISGLAKISGIAEKVITITRNINGSTLGSIPVNAEMKVLSVPQIEGANPDAGRAVVGEKDFNYTQLFHQTVSLSKTAIETASLIGNDYNDLDRQVAEKMGLMMREIGGSIINNYGFEGSNTEARMLRGLPDFLSGDGVVRDVTGGAFSADKLNAVITELAGKGCTTKEFTILCHPVQAAKMSAWNGTNNSTIQIPQTSTTTGGVVQKFVASLPLKDGNAVGSICVDYSFPKDLVYVLSPDSFELSYLQTPYDVDSTVPGSQNISRTIWSEVTVKMLNAKENNAIIENLTI